MSSKKRRLSLGKPSKVSPLDQSTRDFMLRQHEFECTLEDALQAELDSTFRNDMDDEDPYGADLQDYLFTSVRTTTRYVVAEHHGLVWTIRQTYQSINGAPWKLQPGHTLWACAELDAFLLPPNS